jgi:bifunctional UDP-N-acetylglucosamine pyrophosphorylase/glucosamine-1-phosphate N-acetyltransferase
MANKDFAILILAAGKGTRLKSNLAKVLHRAGGRTLVEQVIAACKPLGARAIHIVVGHQSEEVSAAVTPLGAKTVLQKPQRGTGHAMLVARRALKGAKHALVLPGDAPLIRTETLAAMMRQHREGKAAASLLSALLSDPTGYGRVMRRSDGRVAGIVEQSKLAENQQDINEINASMYCFELSRLWPAMSRLKPDNIHRELYLTDTIGILAHDDETVLAQIVEDPPEVLGCNTRAELSEVDRVFRRRIATKWMDAGVSIQYPETVVIDPDVSIEPDTTIEANVQLLGKTRIGGNCAIRTGSIISDCILGDSVLVKPYSILNASRIATGAQVGPYAHLREAADLRENSRVGNFVEVKKSTLGAGVKAMHLSYLGDAKIGEKSNIGAGTITCNYDGVNKNETTIGRGVFIGSDTALVAPVRVGDGAYVGAGSVITENVPPEALAVARGRQTNKPGWARRRRRNLAKGQPGKSSRRTRKKKAAGAKRASRRKNR